MISRINGCFFNRIMYRSYNARVYDVEFILLTVGCKLRNNRTLSSSGNRGYGYQHDDNTIVLLEIHVLILGSSVLVRYIKGILEVLSDILLLYLLL